MKSYSLHTARRRNKFNLSKHREEEVQLSYHWYLLSLMVLGTKVPRRQVPRDLWWGKLEIKWSAFLLPHFFLSFIIDMFCSSPSLKEKGVISSASDIFSRWRLVLVSPSMALTYAEGLVWFHQPSFLPALQAYFGVKRHFSSLFYILRSYLADFTFSPYLPLPRLCNYTRSFHLLLFSNGYYFYI